MNVFMNVFTNTFILVVEIQMGKREQKKKELQMRIINGASELFEEQTFDETTMEQISKRAGVGLGTAYNYFKSKEELFLHIISRQFNGIIESSEKDLSPSVDPAELLAKKLIDQMRIFSRFPKSVWKTILGISFNSLKTNSKIFQALMKADLKVMENIRLFLEECKKKGALKTAEDPGILVDLIYGMLMMQVMIYLYTDSLTFDQACERVQAGIRHILAPKA